MTQNIESPRSLWLSYTAIFLTTFGSAYISTAFFLTLVAISNDFNLSSSQVSWIIYSYYIALLMLIFFGGRLGDFFNKMVLLRIAVVVNILALLFYALAPQYWALVLGATLMGVATSFILPTSTAFLKGNGTYQQQLLAFAIAMAIGGISASFGFLLAGAIESFSSWRWTFSVSIISYAAAFFFTFSYKGKLRNKPININVTSAILLGLCAVSIIILVDNISKWGFESVGILICGIVLICAALLFVVSEKKSSFPIISLELVKDARYRSGVISKFCYNLIQSAIYLLFVFYFQNYFTLDYSPLETSYIFLVIGIPAFLSSYSSKAIVNKIGLDNTVILAFVLWTATLFLTAFFMEGSLLWYHYILLALIGVNLGILSPTIKELTFDTVPKSTLGKSSGVLYIFRYFGSALGAMLVTLIYFQANKLQLAAKLQASKLFTNDFSKLERVLFGHKQSIQEALAQLSPSQQSQIMHDSKTIFNSGFETIFFVLAAIAAFAVLNLVFSLKVSSASKLNRLNK